MPRIHPRRAFGFIRRTVWGALALLRLWAAPETNPFLQRALRIESRGKQPWKIVAGATLSIVVLNALAWWLWNWVHTQIPTLTDKFGPPYLLPRVAGGNWMNGAALLALACCTTAALTVCGTRATQALRREMLGGTLEQLQLLPQREERWLWFFRAHTMLLALLIYACGLPIFCLAVFTDNWSPLDLLGLLFIFISIGHTPPLWMPLQWHANQNRGKKFDLRVLQEAIKQLQKEGKATKGEAAQLEIQRRMARLWESAEPVGEAPAEDGKKKRLISATALPAAFNTGNSNFNGGRFFGWFFAVQAFGPMAAMAGRLPGNPLGVVWTNFKEALPPGVIELAPSFIVSWPLLLERTFLAALPFFAFALPPILLLLPMWIARNIIGNLQLAALVSSSETFWTVRRLRARRAAARWLGAGALLLLCGYGWPSLIEDGLLALALRNAPQLAAPAVATMWALAALWTLCLLIGAALAGNAHEKPFARAEGGEITLRHAWRDAARSDAAHFILAIAAYFLFCWLGAQAPLTKLWQERALPTVLTALAFIGSDFGAAALQAALPPERRGTWKALRALWFYGLALTALGLVIHGALTYNPFTFERAPYVVFSPFVSLFALLRADLNGGANGSVPWWLGPALQAFAGSVCLAIAAIKSFGVPHQAAPQAGEADDSWPAPLVKLWEALVALWQPIGQFFKGVQELMQRAEDGLVQWSTRFGNPVLVAEIKRRQRREHWPAWWIGLPLVLLCAGAQIAYWFSPNIALAIVGGAALTIMALSTFAAAFQTGASFDRDRANGTLVFLFLTPLTEKEIATGKLLTDFIRAAGVYAAMLPFVLIGGAAQIVQGSFQIAIYGGAALLFLPVLLAFNLCVGLLCAVLAKRPLQGIGNAGAAAIFGQILFLICFMLLAVILSLLRGLAFSSAPSDLNDSATLLVIGAWQLLLNLACAIGCWQWALRGLRRQRYSGEVTRGKGAS